MLVINLDANPGPGIATLGQAIIHQLGVTANRNTLARRSQISLGRNCILVITEVVAHVCQQLNQSYAQIGHMPFFPIRHDQRQTIEN